MAWFRLVGGRHIENDKDGKERVYSMGDVFESPLNLLLLNGGPGMSPKFEMLQGPPPGYETPTPPISHTPQPSPPHTPPPPPMPPPVVPSRPPKRNLDQDYGPLDRMSTNDLKQIAKDEGVDLKDASKKEDIIRILRTQVV